MKRLLQIAFVTIVVVGVTTTAFANCIPAKNASNVSRPGYCDGRYVNFSSGSGCVGNDFGGTGCPEVVGSFWQTNNPAVNSGNYLASRWTNGSFGPGFWFFRANLGDGATSAGCPNGCLTVHLSNTATQESITWTRQELVGPAGCFDNDFDWATGGGFGSSPVIALADTRPTVSSSNTTSTVPARTVSLTYNIADVTPGVLLDPACGGVQGQITQTCLYSAESVSTPSQDIGGGGWSLIACHPATGVAGANTSIGCTNTTDDAWIAVGLEVDGQAPSTVGPATQIECDPNMADPPTRKFRKLERGDDDNRLRPRR